VFQRRFANSSRAAFGKGVTAALTRYRASFRENRAAFVDRVWVCYDIAFPVEPSIFMNIKGSPSLEPEWKEAIMTTLVLKNGLAKKALSNAEFVLGEHPIQSGRYWYKGYQNCELELKIQDSGPN
jgi:hypothetical protein